MLSDAVKHVPAVIDILGAEALTDEQVETTVLALTGDEMQSRRLIDWIPEMFAYVLMAHHLKQFAIGRVSTSRPSPSHPRRQGLPPP